MPERAVPQLMQGPAGAVRVVRRGSPLEQVLRFGIGPWPTMKPLGASRGAAEHGNNGPSSPEPVADLGADASG